MHDGPMLLDFNVRRNAPHGSADTGFGRRAA
jgi:hypothetical protein